jgi:hypothetical protein
MVSNLEQIHRLEDGTPNFTYQWTLLSDLFHFGDMIHAEDKPKFVAAMENEMNDLRDFIESVPRSSLPEGTSIFPAVWAFKHKTTSLDNTQAKPILICRYF